MKNKKHSFVLFGSVFLLISCILLTTDTVHFVPEHVFHIPLASPEAVLHRNIPFIFRIKSKSLVCLPGPTKSSVMWSLPSSFWPQNLLLSLLLLQPIYTGLLAFLKHAKVIPAFWTLDVPSTCYTVPTTPPLFSNDSLLPFRPAPHKVLPWSFCPLPTDLPLPNPFVSTYSALLSSQHWSLPGII